MRRHRTSLTSLVAGLTFAVVGCYGMLVDPERLADGVRWVWPTVLVGLGIALLVGSTRNADRSDARPGPSPREDGAGDEVGAERGEDGEIEQAGGGHDRGVGTLP